MSFWFKLSRKSIVPTSWPGETGEEKRGRCGVKKEREVGEQRRSEQQRLESCGQGWREVVREPFWRKRVAEGWLSPRGRDGRGLADLVPELLVDTLPDEDDALAVQAVPEVHPLPAVLPRRAVRHPGNPDWHHRHDALCGSPTRPAPQGTDSCQHTRNIERNCVSSCATHTHGSCHATEPAGTLPNREARQRVAFASRITQNQM